MFFHRLFPFFPFQPRPETAGKERNVLRGGKQTKRRHLLVVFKLLQGENVLIEIFLKLLVCIVDVELLKAVHLRGANQNTKIMNSKKFLRFVHQSKTKYTDNTGIRWTELQDHVIKCLLLISHIKDKVNANLKVLKSKNVEDADGFEVLLAPDAVVQLVNDPVETLGIKCHGHGVPGVHRLRKHRLL